MKNFKYSFSQIDINVPLQPKIKLMLSRRYLRVKAFQAVFGFIVSGDDNLEVAQKNLLRSLDKLYELFIYQLSLLIELNEFAEKKIAANKKKFFPSEDDLNPNLRFVQNRISKLLRENRELQSEIERFKISWRDEEPMIRKLYSIIQESKTYHKYIQDEDNFDSDRTVWVKIIKNQIANFDVLRSYYEAKNSVWVDDFTIVNHLLIKFIKSFTPQDDEHKVLPAVFRNEKGAYVPEDKEFYIDLFTKTILKQEENIELIRSKVQNWELERIATTDMIILQMAITEFTEFPSIPIKVSLNEYIELAKMFSTPNSHIFVNGVLDRTISQLLRENKIKKTGRGLIDRSLRKE